MTARPVRTVVAASLVLGGSSCGADAIITLGQESPLPAFTDAGRRVRFINEEREDEANPTFTADLLEIYFTSGRAGGSGGGDVWYATRLSRVDPFDPPRPLALVNSEQVESSAAISADGLTLYVGSDRPHGASGGDMNIWRATRSSRESAWGPMQYVEELNTEWDDQPRPLALGGLAMVLVSRREGEDYQTYLATRPGAGAKFDTIQPLRELWVGGTSVNDAFMMEDGMVVLFSRQAEGGHADLYMAWRDSLRDGFGEAAPLAPVNTSADERDPWVSADGERLFFASDRRDGMAFDIYGTKIVLPRFEP